MSNDVAQLGIAVDTSGVVAADAALDRLVGAAVDASAAVSKVTQAATTASTATVALTAKSGELRAILERIAASTAATSATLATMASRTQTVAVAHTNLANAVTRSTAALHGHTAGMGNARVGMMEFEHSIRSIIDGLGAGMSPMHIFAMEGARLGEAFQMSGDVWQRRFQGYEPDRALDGRCRRARRGRRVCLLGMGKSARVATERA